MASGGSSGRPVSGSRPFDFGSDDVLCSYDDSASASQGLSNGRRSDTLGKDFHDSRMGRPLINIYEQEDYSKENVLLAVEKCMKKYADNILHSLEGVSGRLSQLEIYCYKLERSIGEFRSEMTQDRSEEDLKFKSLEKHLQEIHRSVQILRDKQELAETQKELTKLQLVQKESTQKNEEGVTSSVSESKKHDDQPEPANQLAIVPSGQANIPQSLPSQIQFIPPQIQPYKEQIPQQAASVPQSVRQDHYVVNQANAYYPQRQTAVQDQQSQTFQPEVQYMQARSQSQDLPTQDPAQRPQMMNQARSQSFPQYQQQWPPQPPQQFQPQVVQPQQPSTQQLPPKVVQPQLPPLQAQIGSQAPPSYPPYSSYQPGNPVPETFSGSMAKQGQYSTIHQPGATRSEVAPLGYGGQGGTTPTQHNTQGPYGPHMTKVEYTSTASYRPPVNVQGYNAPYNYSVSNVPPAHSPQLPSSEYGRSRHPGQQIMLNHPYGDMIEKAISMGYPREQVIGVTHKMAESGQPMDFNVLLDRLNGGSASMPPREW
ncbi:uncharacterized protein [Typha angustifolia]|uniref:uncharacterized protein n=1 Tax=Typha angustifolia TaxID=59011 RepID=UPI003C300E54